MLVNICVCTYKRPGRLEKCLNSLRVMDYPESADVCITVVDNDKAGSSRNVVDTFRGDSAVSIHYEIEEKRGIPCARNRALEISRSMHADLMLFIDDDEHVHKSWLLEMLNVSKEYRHEAVVHGLVVPCLPDGVQDDIACFFQPKRRDEGKELSACATDNVLMPVSFFSKNELAFDESRPLAGGTDTMFFTMAKNMGIRIIQTNRAVVYEDIPVSRLSLRWLVRRKFRAGLTDAWRRRQKGRLWIALVLVSLFHVTKNIFLALFYQAVLRPCERNRSILGVAKYSGIFMGCIGFFVDSYSSIDS